MPGSLFLPEYLYTLKIEHDGGLRIDSRLVSNILRGEQYRRKRIMSKKLITGDNSPFLTILHIQKRLDTGCATCKMLKR